MEDVEVSDCGAAAHAPKDIAGLGTIEQGNLRARGGAESGADPEDELSVCVSGRVQFERSAESSRGGKIVDAGQEGEAAERGAGKVRGRGKPFAGIVGGAGLRFAVNSS